MDQYRLFAGRAHEYIRSTSKQGRQLHPKSTDFLQEIGSIGPLVRGSVTREKYFQIDECYHRHLRSYFTP
jgi:hypothetical protein